jgi:hypothetical protein
MYKITYECAEFAPFPVGRNEFCPLKHGKRLPCHSPLFYSRFFADIQMEEIFMKITASLFMTVLFALFPVTRSGADTVLIMIIETGVNPEAASGMAGVWESGMILAPYLRGSS